MIKTIQKTKQVETTKINNSKQKAEKLQNYKTIPFQEKKELWQNQAISSNQNKTCNVCKRSKKRKLITYDGKNICYSCWIKTNKKAKKSQKKKQNFLDQLDPAIYITSKEWEDIR